MGSIANMSIYQVFCVYLPDFVSAQADAIYLTLTLCSVCPSPDYAGTICMEAPILTELYADASGALSSIREKDQLLQVEGCECGIMEN